MTEQEYFQKRAELHRRTSRNYVPDAPVMKHMGKVADGTLREMVDRWAALSPSDRLHHVVLVGGGSLSDSALEALIERARRLDT